MKKKFPGVIIFCIGSLLMIMATITGKMVIPEASKLGAAAYWHTSQILEKVLFAFFALGFPLGSVIMLIGAKYFSEPVKKKLFLFIASAFGITLLPVLIILIFGINTSPLFFGFGGSIITLLFLLVGWNWGEFRAGLSKDEKKATDFQMLGYLFFALAAWQICAVGGVPGFALYPEKMIAFESQPIAVAQMKITMVTFILAWVFTLLGLRKKAKN
jgi:hypothetical protein